MTDHYQTFRVLPDHFPVPFPALRKHWCLELHDIRGTAGWRAHLVPDDASRTASAGYFVVGGFTREDLVQKLRIRGFNVLRRSPVGTLLRAMAAQGLAEPILVGKSAA